MVAAAVIGAGLLTAAGTAYAGSEASSATRDAAATASNATLTAQDRALAQTKPYTDLGNASIKNYQALLDPKTAQSTLENLPGYQFTRDQGIEAAKRSSAASGLNLSGNQLAGVTGYASSLADTTYQTELSNLLAPVQIGEAAATGNAANIMTAGTNLGNIALGAGNNLANIDANTIAGLTKTANTGINQYLTYNTLKGLNPGSDPAVSGVPTYGSGSVNAVDPGVNAPVNTPIYT